MKIDSVTVVGANGNMGSNVSGIIASFGSAKVFLISRKLEDSKETIDKICQSIRTDDIRNRLIPKTYDDLSECVNQSDWVFESVAEDMAVKISITEQIFEAAKNNTIVTTGTSGLSISTIAQMLSEKNRSRYFGTHFFNPPYNLSLCELIDTKYTDRKILHSFYDYLQNTLLRTVIFSKDAPAFLANRVGFQFINSAMLLAEELKEQGGIDYVDYLFQGITGRGMPPLVTANFVGLDIHTAIIENLEMNTSDYENKSFKSPTYLNELVLLNHLGVKTKVGLYKKELVDGKSIQMVYDLKTKKYRETKNYRISVIEEMKSFIQKSAYEDAFCLLRESASDEAAIIKKVLAKHIIYSAFVSKEVSNGLPSIDSALVSGFNWVSPSDLLYLMGGIDSIKEIYLDGENKSDQGLNNSELDALLNKENLVVTKSKYDYRKFIKA